MNNYGINRKQLNEALQEAMHLKNWLQAFMETPGTLTFTTENIYIIL